MSQNDLTQPEQKPLVIITGAGGLIGRRLIERLHSEYQIAGMEVEIKDQDSRVTWYETDLTDDDSVRKSLADIRNDFGATIYSVIHLAAYYDFSGEPSDMYDKLTVQGTQRLLEQLAGFEVGQFMFSSTLLAMAPSADKLLNEQSPTQAEWDYPESKLRAEEVIRQHAGEMKTVILRIAGVYDEYGNSLPLSQQISRIFEKQLESYLFPGNQNRGQALIHLDDLAECVRLLLQRRDELLNQEIFLIAEPDVMTYGELQDRLGELIHGQEWTTIRIPEFVAKAGAWVKGKLASSEEEKPFIKPWMVSMADDHYEADISHLREQTGWEPPHRLRNTLDEIIASLFRDPQGWYQHHKLPWPENGDKLKEKALEHQQQQ